jgi:hypothetical protein
VRSQDAVFIYTGMLQNPVARKQGWNFIREHWQQLEEKLGENSIRWVVETTGSFCDSASRQQVQTFFAEHKVPSAARAVQNALERIDYCTDLRTQQGSKLATWLDNRVKTETGQ